MEERVQRLKKGGSTGRGCNLICDFINVISLKLMKGWKLDSVGDLHTARQPAQSPTPVVVGLKGSEVGATKHV